MSNRILTAAKVKVVIASRLQSALMIVSIVWFMPNVLRNCVLASEFNEMFDIIYESIMKWF